MPKVFRSQLPAAGLWCALGLGMCLLLLLGAWTASAQVSVAAPRGNLVGTLFTDSHGRLLYKVAFNGEDVILASPLGLTRDGLDLGAHVTLGAPVLSTVDERFPMRGGKREARDHATLARIPASSHGVAYTVEARAFDDGFAWRIVVPGTGTHHIGGESSSWTLPEKTNVWYADRPNAWKLKSYAGEWFRTGMDQLPTISTQGPIQTAPLVAELPGGPYVLITEAALANYSGMRLRALAGRRVQADFTEGAKGFDVEGEVATPWRVTLVCPTLQALVNSDVLQGLNPPPDPKLFADTSYIRPGRSVWRYWSRQTGTPAQEREFVDYAQKLGFEYTLVDDGWDAWPDKWQAMTALCAYAAEHHVAVFAWRDSKYLMNPADQWAALRDFLDRSHEAGLAGVKIDFINGESKDRMDFEIAALRLAAERRLMVDFHGIQKPTGEVRTYPNAISREGIRGVELNKMPEGPITPSHNAALPFTRFAVGDGDYTPLSYTWPGETTWAHQLATVIAFTSPFMTIAEDPEFLLKDKAAAAGLEVLKATPAVWDETFVLPQSRIGELSVIARRSGTAWFLSVLNGKNEACDLRLPDLSFLGAGSYKAVVITSPERRSLTRRELTLTMSSTLDARLSAGDGLVVWFRPSPMP